MEFQLGLRDILQAHCNPNLREKFKWTEIQCTLLGTVRLNYLGGTKFKFLIVAWMNSKVNKKRASIGIWRKIVLSIWIFLSFSFLSHYFYPYQSVNQSFFSLFTNMKWLWRFKGQKCPQTTERFGHLEKQ